MTDHDPLDDLASAHLDGRTTASERARVEADPDLAARVARMAAARRALRTLADEPVDPAERERTIAAALAAADAAPAPEPTAPLVRVVDLGTRVARTPRSAWRRLELVAIAAVVVLLALAVPLLARLDDGRSEDTAARVESDELGAASEADDSDGAATSTLGGAAEDAAGSADQSADAFNAAAVDLGAVADLRELEDTVRAALARPAGSEAHDVAPPVGTTSGPACVTTARAEAERSGALVLDGEAILDRRPVAVFVVDRPDGQRVLRVLDVEAGCEVVAVSRL